jgi:hypothetical protein
MPSNLKKETAKQNKAEQKSQPLPNQPQNLGPNLGPEKVLFSWKTQSKIYKPRDVEFWKKAFAISAVFGLILFIAEGVMPVILLSATIFLMFVLSKLPNQEVQCQITTSGVRIAGQLNPWSNFTHFRFVKRADTTLLRLGMLSLPGSIELVINEADIDKIRKATSQFLIEEEQPLTRTEKFIDWLSLKIS